MGIIGAIILGIVVAAIINISEENRNAYKKKKKPE